MTDNNNHILEIIINKIKSNRISTTEVADCLGKKGVLAGVYPLNRMQFRVGKVFLAYAFNDSNWEVHEQLQDVNKGDIVLVETYNCNDRAVFGDLVSKFLALYKQVSAIVVNGYLRDTHNLIKENYPIWCKGFTPIGCYNRKNEIELDHEIVNSWSKKYNGAIAVCDDAGVVIIPPDSINEEFSEMLDFIELQEDIWYYCIDTKKWSTYDTVCLKKYLDVELLPDELREKFKQFNKKRN